MRALVARAASTIGIAPEGAALSFGAALSALVVWLCGLPWLAAVILAVALAVGSFFRDPDRFPPEAQGVVISGADGKVVDVSEGAPPGMRDRRWRRVSVFMSPLNVHVNRAPVGGEVRAIEHTPGEFRAAFRDHAAERNERNLILFRDGEGREHALMQVAGYMARRIICRLRTHDRVQRGQRIGLIMFGSRVDHFMPLEYRTTVRTGDRVRAGISVIGELSQ